MIRKLVFETRFPPWVFLLGFSAGFSYWVLSFLLMQERQFPELSAHNKDLGWILAFWGILGWLVAELTLR